MMIIFSFSLSHLLLKRKKERRKPKQKRIGAAAVDERRADELVITSPPGNVLPPPGCIKNASVADPVRYINSHTASNFGQKKKNLLFQTSIAFGVLVLSLFIMYEAIITAPSRHIYDSEEESGAQSAVMMFLEFLYFMFYRLTLCRHRRGKEFLVGVYATLIQSIARILYNK